MTALGAGPFRRVVEFGVFRTWRFHSGHFGETFRVEIDLAVEPIPEQIKGRILCSLLQRRELATNGDSSTRFCRASRIRIRTACSTASPLVPETICSIWIRPIETESSSGAPLTEVRRTAWITSANLNSISVSSENAGATRNRNFHHMSHPWPDLAGGCGNSEFR